MFTSQDLLEIHTFGRVAVRWQGTPVLLSPREKAFLIYLAYHRIPVSRTQLCGLFWPNDSNARARGNLRKLLTDIRKSMGAFLIADRESAALVDDSYWLDVHEFQRHIYPLDSLSGLRHTITESDILHLVKATQLYQGEFLANMKLPQSKRFVAWIEEKQHTLYQQAITALKQLLLCQTRLGQYDQAINQANRLLELNPFDEEVNRQLIHLLAHHNQLSAALEHFHRYTYLVNRERNGTVDVALTQLYERLRVGDVPPLFVEPSALSVRTTEQNDIVLHRVPIPLTPLIGRSEVLVELHQYLQSSTARLITLTGLGGIGKTRLALALIDQAHSYFIDGVTYIALKPSLAFPQGHSSQNSVSSYEWVLRATAQVVGISLDVDDDTVEQQLIYQLHNKNQLMIFDGFERFIDGAPFLIKLLQNAPSLKIIVTSREVLQIIGELVIEVEGLGFTRVPNEGQNTKATHQLSQSFVNGNTDFVDAPCIQLFIACAKRQKPGITFVPENFGQIAQICHLLDNNPLAIELAASLITHYPYHELITILRENLNALDTLCWGRAPNLQSMKSILEESWQSLSSLERKTLLDLSLLPTDFGRDNGLQLKGISSQTLIGLTQKSMIRVTALGRYRLPRLVRMFVRQKRHQLGIKSSSSAQRIQEVL